MQKLSLLLAISALGMAGCATTHHETPGKNSFINNSKPLTLKNGVVIKAKALQPAKYPDELRRRRVEGVVILRVKVLPDGSVAEAQVVEASDSRLAPLAVEAAYGSTYEPYPEALAPFAWFRYPVTFKVRD